MNILKITYMRFDNSKVFINYDDLSVKYYVDPEDAEVVSWTEQGNTITPYPFGNESSLSEETPAE